MSFHVTALVMRTKFGNSQRKCIALKLADCANDDGTKIFPSVNTIAEHSEVCKSTVQRTLNCFMAAGVLICIKKGGKGPKDTSEYAFNIKLLEEIACGFKEFETYRDDGKRQQWRVIDAPIMEDLG